MFALSHTRFVPLAFIAAVAASTLQFAAFAAPPVTPTAEVHTHDLNLTRSADVKLLNQRLNRAVRAVCQPSGPELSAFSAANECKRAAFARANVRRDVLVARAQTEQMASIQSGARIN